MDCFYLNTFYSILALPNWFISFILTYIYRIFLSFKHIKWPNNVQSWQQRHWDCINVFSSRLKSFSLEIRTHDPWISFPMLSQLSWRAWNKDDLAQLMFTQEVTLKHTNLCLVVSSRESSSPNWYNFISLIYFHSRTVLS